MRLTGKTAMVTGAAGGIGSATALCFAAEGASLILSDCNLEGCVEVAEKIKEQGGNAVVQTADVTREEDISRLFSFVRSSSAALDILVNIAGGDHEPVADVDAIDYDSMSRITGSPKNISASPIFFGPTTLFLNSCLILVMSSG